MNTALPTRESTARAYVGPSSSSLLTLPGYRPLYVAGDPSLLGPPAIAIIGSRHASTAGLEAARALARQLVLRGYVILSGLADGVDRAAHEGAIGAGGRTVAVIGTSLERAYPRQHAALQERVYREHLLVSPFLPGATTARWHFPLRNRVMAQLAQATVLVEATEESGTRHQVEECVKLGRTVYAQSALIRGITWLGGAPEGTIVSWTDVPDVERRLDVALEKMQS